MSLCGDLRSEAVQLRQHELTNCARAHRDSIRALLAVWGTVHSNTSPSALQNVTFDPDSSTKAEVDFLDNHDLTRGRIFDATTLTLPFHPASSRHATPSSSSNAKDLLDRPAADSHATNVHHASPAGSIVVAGPGSAPNSPTVDNELDGRTQAEQQHTSHLTPLSPDASSKVNVPASSSAEPDGPSGRPADLAPPLPEDEATFSESTRRLLEKETPHPPAKTIHLPPEHVQVERLRERKAAEEQFLHRNAQDDAKSERPSVPQIQATNDVPSSPSSTVGPHSAATPRPPEESPDTSPDSGRADAEEILPPEDLRPTPEQQRQKEEHDRIHAAQMEIARQQALGDVNTPDDQLKWEEREAAAREAEEHAGRAGRSGPEPDLQRGLGPTEAQSVESEMKIDTAISEQLVASNATASAATSNRKDLDDETAVVSQSGSNTTDERPVGHQETPAKRSNNTLEAVSPTASNDNSKLPAQPDNAVESSNSALHHMQDDGDNIIVTPRTRPSDPVDASAMRERQSRSESTPALPERMTTRVSSGAVRKRTVSDILDRTPPSGYRDNLSPEPISPSSVRRRPESSSMPPTSPLRTPKSAVWSHNRMRASSSEKRRHTQSALDQLEVLKGAASDPNKDYLEPLFRIQAHDSANNTFSKPLPDLVKSASKALSTDDHFIQLHERMDFRMLRRIYQLQNANKWSLRQMEKAKEPEPPVTHQDHMMAEMKWMRKDFKAERKMKKSVCAWLAQRCAQWINAGAEDRRRMQVRLRPVLKRQTFEDDEHAVPELDRAAESGPEDENSPQTPTDQIVFGGTLVVPPELFDSVEEMSKTGRLARALERLPKSGLVPRSVQHEIPPVTTVSKFVEGKLLPSVKGQGRKRSRFDFEDESETLEARPQLKRIHTDAVTQPEDPDCALFHPDNKQIRDRLHSNTAFRPPSEFMMPGNSFYDNRNGSQWSFEDDQKLRKLAKDYSFNWSLISEDLALPTLHKSWLDRRTPWECFERWVELESLPADMKRTTYFKTWFQRLEVGDKAAERRYQAQVAMAQQQAQANNTQPREVQRRSTRPTRVEKRRSARHVWVIDACRKIARKRELQIAKMADNTRAAAHRKPQNDNNPQRKLETPQEISRRRYEQDVKAQQQLLEQRKRFQDQQRQIIQARMAQQQQQQQIQVQQTAQQQSQQQQAIAGAPNSQQQQMPQQQRQSGPNAAVQQAQMQANGQPNARLNPQQMAMQRTDAPAGPLQIPMLNSMMVLSSIPQPHLRFHLRQDPNLRRRVEEQLAKGVPGSNPQWREYAQANGIYQREYQPANGSAFASPGGTGNMTPQQIQQQQAWMFNAQQQAGNNAGQAQAGAQNLNNTPNVSSPGMPPPPNPAQHAGPQQLSSGLVPLITQIKNYLRATNPNMPEEQLNALATQQIQKQNNQHQARQSAMNAAAGIGTPSHAGSNSSPNMQAFAAHPAQQNNYPQVNGQMANNSNVLYSNMNGHTEGAGAQQQTSQPSGMSPSTAASQQQAYALKMRQRQMAQMQQQQQQQFHNSPNATHARLAVGSSPSIAHASPGIVVASPNMTPVSPAAQMQRPPSRSATPQVAGQQQRMASVGNMQSPGVQHPQMQMQQGGGSPSAMRNSQPPQATAASTAR